MPGSTISVAQSVASGTVGRLTHVHYVPIYNAHRLRRRQREILEQNLRATQRSRLPSIGPGDSRTNRRTSRNKREYKPIQSARRRQLENLLQTQTFDVPSNYIGARYPLLPKIGVERELTKHGASESTISQAAQSHQAPSEYQREMSKTMESQSRSREISGALKLPQIMKSFIPTEGRKLPPRPQVDSRSTWIDLTGNRNMKQVAPSGYKATTFDIGVRPVTLVTVDYDKNLPKLHRRPLPPIQSSTPQTNARKQKKSQIWHPAESQSKIGDVKGSQAHQHNRPGVTRSPHTDAGKKLLENLNVKVDETRKQNIPPIKTTKLHPGGQIHVEGGAGHWESGKMRAQRNVRKRAESDRHFGNFRNGVILNKLPSDLIGSYRATFENLNYYLGRGAVKPKGEKAGEEGVIVIPTGRQGENPEYEIDEDAINPEFIRHLTHQCDVKMRYAHRCSSDTPSMERMPWEENDTGSDAEMAARNAALASMQRSGSRKVRRLTVKLPEMPYVKQERLRAPPATPIDVPDTVRSSEPCQFCQDNEIEKQVAVNAKAAPGLPIKISRKDFGAELLGGGAAQGGKLWHGVRPLVADEARILRGEMKTIHEEPKRNLTEQLILAHGEMKRRRDHDCGKKEILITPFAVKINDKSSSSSSIDLSSSRKPARSDFRSSITKPYTFSYMSANKKRASQARDQLAANQLCNSPDKQSKAKANESWYIKNFVNVTPADVSHSDDVTDDDVIPPNTPVTKSSSQDKATEPIETSQASDKVKQRGKRRRRVKLTHPPNAPVAQPMVTSET